MAETATIARPYAEAVFRLAQESGSLATWSERTQRLAAVVQDEEMARCIGNPKIQAEQVEQALAAIIGGEGQVELTNFLSILSRNNRLALLPEIAKIFEQLKRNVEGIQEAVIQSAFPLEGELLDKLLPGLEKHFGTKLQPRVTLDPELIGGVRVTVGDRVYDASIRGSLEAMTTALKN